MSRGSQRMLAVLCAVALMVLGGLWIGSEAPFSSWSDLTDWSAEALDAKANKAAVACALIAAYCAVIGTIMLRKISNIEKRARDKR